MTPVCAVDGCDRRVHARRLCDAHYRWSLRHDWATPSHGLGTLPAIRQLADVLSRVKVDERTGCWLWRGWVKAGHGKVWVGGRYRRPEAFIWERMVGPVPDGTTLLQGCQNPRCVKPEHLVPTPAKRRG